jgi:hypothetical protein
LTLQALLLKDLSPHVAADADEDAWLARLARHLTDHDRLQLTRRRRQDDEDDAAMARAGDGPADSSARSISMGASFRSRRDWG